MSHSKTGSVLLQVIKTLIIALFKLAGLAIALTCKLVGVVLQKISELLEKMIGHGSSH